MDSEILIYPIKLFLTFFINLRKLLLDVLKWF